MSILQTSHQRLLKLKEAAERLNVSTRTVQRLAAAQEFATVKIRGTTRYLEAEIDAYLKRQIR